MLQQVTAVAEDNAIASPCILWGEAFLFFKSLLARLLSKTFKFILKSLLVLSLCAILLHEFFTSVISIFVLLFLYFCIFCIFRSCDTTFAVAGAILWGTNVDMCPPLLSITANLYLELGLDISGRFCQTHIIIFELFIRNTIPFMKYTGQVT